MPAFIKKLYKILKAKNLKRKIFVFGWLLILLLITLIWYFKKNTPKTAAIYLQEGFGKIVNSKAGFGQITESKNQRINSVSQPITEQLPLEEQTSPLPQTQNSLSFKFKTGLSSLLSLPYKTYLHLKPRKKTLYSHQAQRFLVDLVKSDIQDDLNKLTSKEIDQEDVKNLSQKILSALDKSQVQIGQQIKLENKKILAKTSIQGEVMLPINPGQWQIDANPLKDINIFLPEQKIKVDEKKAGFVLLIPMTKGSGQVIYSKKVFSLPLTQETILKSTYQTNYLLSQYLNESRALKQKIGLILIFRDDNNNQLFDNTESLVPWAGVSFELKK